MWNKSWYDGLYVPGTGCIGTPMIGLDNLEGGNVVTRLQPTYSEFRIENRRKPRILIDRGGASALGGGLNALCSELMRRSDVNFFWADDIDHVQCFITNRLAQLSVDNVWVGVYINSCNDISEGVHFLNKSVIKNRFLVFNHIDESVLDANLSGIDWIVVADVGHEEVAPGGTGATSLMRLLDKDCSDRMAGIQCLQVKCISEGIALFIETLGKAD